MRRHRLGGLPATEVAKRARTDQQDRGAALATIWRIVAKHFPQASAVRVVLEEDSDPLGSVSLRAMVERKATSTLQKRACSLRMYDAWLSSSTVASGFGDEPTVFAYATHLFEDKAPATRAAALVESLNFLEGVFALDLLQVRASARIKGMCVRSLRTRAAVRQRATFTVELVKVLERILADDAGKGGSDGVLAGAALFSIYARVRIGDLRRCCVEPMLDVVNGRGYVETEFLDHKTAVPGTRKALPIVAPACGLSGPWAARWMATRRSAGLNAANDMTILPAMGEAGVWTDVPFTTVEFASSVREVLLRHGVSAEALTNIGAHSMKATLLSWTAKYGIAKPIRRTLGYHTDANDKAVETYSRDAMALPLRELERVLEAVRVGSFFPDSTRSGLFKNTDIDCRELPRQVAGDRSGEELSRLSPSRDPRCLRPALPVDHHGP